MPMDMDYDVIRDDPRDGLRSMREICAFSGYSEKIVRELVREANFPARIIGGKWESSRKLIENWRRNQVLAA